ncbi:insulinase family protein [Paraglaciecola sp.]|uniref:insulinase family protein n=1 Tax=Paraglaciecola sp. TaxID=1920173 RepID=UPI003EF37213
MRISDHDHRQFKHLTLHNGLRVFLIQDEFCDKSAASITVNSGHFNDDNDCQGLSHLLEHMLFLGDRNNATANHVPNFLESINGSINALTGTEFTSYFLDCPDEHLLQSLHLLGGMLIHPLFDEALLTNEIEVIDAEFQLKRKDELRRLYQVHKETCNQVHPFSQFSVGNKDIFQSFPSSELQKKLKTLHNKYYQPQNACLCIVSPLHLDELHIHVENCFKSWKKETPIGSKKLPPLYAPENLAININIKPIVKTQRLIITFALPNPKQDFRSKPLIILSHIFGDEGEGSLLHFYKQKGWATSVNAGGGIEGSNFKDFNINIQLTPAGIGKINEITQTLFSFIHLIKNDGIESWRIEEVAAINQLMWHYAETTKSVDESLHISQTMFEYPKEFLLEGDYVLDQIKPDLVLELLEYFTPENMRLKSIWPDIKTNQIAKYYETPYAVDKISNQLIQAFSNKNVDSSLNLAKPNEFLPKEQAIKPINQKFDTPQKVIEDPGLHIWYGQDSKFNQPKGDCYLTFDCLAVNQGIEVVTAKRLWIALLNEKLNQRYYQANLAGMHFHFYPHQGGFSLQTNGFSDNQLEFYSKLLTQIVKHEYFEHSFEQVKNRQLLGLSNKLLNKPINSLFARLAVLMQQHNYMPLDMCDVMQSITPEVIYQTKNQLLNQFHLKGLMYGNWTHAEALDISKVIKSFRNNYKTGDKVPRGVADIRHQPTYIHQVESQHSDSAVVIYFQSPDAGVKNTVLTIIAEQVVSGPFFHQLRTEQQLGYLVGSGYIPYNQHPGLAFYVQSPQASVEQLVEAIHTFIRQITKDLNQYTNFWQTIKNGVIKQLSEKDTNLSMKAQRFWMAINNQDNDFSHSQKMIQAIEGLDLNELIVFFEQLLERQEFGEIILHCGTYSNSSKDQQFQNINDPKIFKKTTRYL